MRVLLVIEKGQVLDTLSALNPKLDYCAIVTKSVKPAKKILEQVGLSKDLLRPLTDLKACVEGLNYDYVLCAEGKFYKGKIINEVRKYDVPRDKMFNLCKLSSLSNFKIKQVLSYYREHRQDFEMFATGISYVAHALDVTKFKRRLFKLAKPSQDLYYDFQIAKFVISCGGGGIIYDMR